MTRLAEEKLKEFFWENEYIRERLEQALGDVASGKQSPYQAADQIVAHFKIDGEQRKIR